MFCKLPERSRVQVQLQFHHDLLVTNIFGKEIFSPIRKSDGWWMRCVIFVSSLVVVELKTNRCVHFLRKKMETKSFYFNELLNDKTQSHPITFNIKKQLHNKLTKMFIYFTVSLFSVFQRFADRWLSWPHTK